MNDFRTSLLRFNTERWDQTLGSLKLTNSIEYPARGNLDDIDLSTLSALRVDLVDFSSPVKDQAIF